MSNRNIPDLPLQFTEANNEFAIAVSSAINELFKRVYTLTNPNNLRQVSGSSSISYAEQGISVDSTSGNLVIFLPDLSQAERRPYVVHKTVAANDVVVTATALNGGTTDTISSQYETKLYYPLPDYWTIL